MNPKELLRDLSQSSDPRLRRARHALSKAQKDLKLRGDLCNNVSHIYASQGDYERAFRWARLDLNICQQRRDAVATVIGLRVWYDVASLTHLPMHAHTHTHTTLPAQTRSGQFRREGSHVLESLDYLLRALRMCKSEREKENKEITFEHLQGVHTEIGNSARELAHRCREGDTVKSQIWADRFSLAQARHCYASVRLAYEIASRRDSSVADESWSMAWKAASDAYFNYGNFLADSKLLKTARIYFELAHASARKACDSIREGRARHGLGDVLMHQCRFAEASNQYLRDAALLARLKNPPIYDRKATLSNCVRALLRTNEKGGLERAARCAEELQRLGNSGEVNWISLVQRVKRDRNLILRRARGLVRTIEDILSQEKFTDIINNNKETTTQQLCKDIQLICNQIDTLIEEKITTSELHDLHVRCLEARARVLRRTSPSMIESAGLDAGLARLAAAENSPRPQSLEHVSRAVEWLRAAAKSLESKRNEDRFRDTQLRVLVSLGDAYALRVQIRKEEEKEEKKSKTEDHEFAVSCYRQAHRLGTRFGKSRLAHMALENLFIHLCERREFREAERIEKQLCVLEGRDHHLEKDSEETIFLAQCQEKCTAQQESLFGRSISMNDDEDSRSFAMSRIVVGEHLLATKKKNRLKKRQKTSSIDRNTLKWTHEIATCDAEFVGTWDGDWEPCALIENIGNLCHVICRVDGKDVFAPQHLVRRVRNAKEQEKTTSAAEWYDMFCKRDDLKPCENVNAELLLRNGKRDVSTLRFRDVSRDAHIFNGIRAVLKSCRNNSIQTLEICGGLCDRKKKTEFFKVLREIETISTLRLECHRLGPDMTRDLIRFVVQETKIRDLEISFDSTRRGISSLSSSFSVSLSLRRLSLRACGLFDLDPIVSILLHSRLEELDLSDNPVELTDVVRKVLCSREKSLRTLCLQSITDSRSCDDDTIKALFESCTDELDLSRNKFVRKISKQISRVIRLNNIKLKTLKLNDCSLTDSNLRSILSISGESSSLCHLHARSSALQDKILFDRNDHDLDIVTLFKLRSLHLSNLNMPNDAYSLIRALHRGARRRHVRDEFVLDLCGNVWTSPPPTTTTNSNSTSIREFTNKCAGLARMFDRFILRIESWTLNENSRILERLWITENDLKRKSPLLGRYSVTTNSHGFPFEFRWDSSNSFS